MHGQMMDVQLTITTIMRHARRYNGDAPVLSVTADAPRHRTTYGECFARAARLAGALAGRGVRPGDRIATLAWNDHRHLEIYYGVSCMGAVLHTINPRLFDEQVRYIATHAADRIVFVDLAFLPLVERVAASLPGVETWVALTDDAHLPVTSVPNLVSYERLIADGTDDFAWPDLDERSASSLCYTSGTTGHPKGVLYHHRSTVLHAYAAALPDSLDLSMQDVVLPVVPMFHVNAWGVPYAAVMTGAGLVLPGPKLGDPATLYELIEGEGVTLALGVPTVWMGLLAWCERNGRTLTRLRRCVIGGSACPPAVIEQFRKHHGVEVKHAWGMTEMSPLGTVNSLKPRLARLTSAEKLPVQSKQGRPVFGVELKIVDADERELPHDGQTFGLLKVRGPWVCSSYYAPDSPGDAHDAAGWFATGDVATVDPDGYLQITDRAKDVIKSGGEWISSIDLENLAVAHPAVAEAAVIAMPHPKWQERPLLVVVLAPGASATREELLAWFDGKVARWWIPDDVAFVTSLPHTATGKISKRDLRTQIVGAVPAAGS